MSSQYLYLGLLSVVAVERLVELVISQRNLRWARSQKGVEVGARHYPWMVVTHLGLLIFSALEVMLLDRPFLPLLGWPMLALVGATMILRYWVITTLGKRWNTRVVVVPGIVVAHNGPYRWLRHPNYLAVIIEVAALPLVHTAWLSAAVFSLANAAVLFVRIRVEERALQELAQGAEPDGRRLLLPFGS
jgi:methyltransferase